MAISSLPRHVAIVMDGNGRWAKQRFLPHVAGHRAGVETARHIVQHCAKLNIEVLSLFAFSSENWLRPAKEVNYLMELFFIALRDELSTMREHNIQLRFIGNRSRFNPKLHHKIIEVEEATRHHTGMVLLIAIDYGGQWDICQAVERLIKETCYSNESCHPYESCHPRAGGDPFLNVQITPEQIKSRLSFADLPDPDLFIRTSGELRISNFMLWQLAYAELYFTDSLWPDFTVQALEEALLHFSCRERRYGARPMDE